MSFGKGLLPFVEALCVPRRLFTSSKTLGSLLMTVTITVTCV